VSWGSFDSNEQQLVIVDSVLNVLDALFAIASNESTSNKKTNQTYWHIDSPIYPYRDATMATATTSPTPVSPKTIRVQKAIINNNTSRDDISLGAKVVSWPLWK